MLQSSSGRAYIIYNINNCFLQAKFEELLKVHPPEPVERKRFQKIAKALGTRTTQQVEHVKKYQINYESFISCLSARIIASAQILRLNLLQWGFWL